MFNRLGTEFIEMRFKASACYADALFALDHVGGMPSRSVGMFSVRHLFRQHANAMREQSNFNAT